MGAYSANREPSLGKATGGGEIRLAVGVGATSGCAADCWMGTGGGAGSAVTMRGAAGAGAGAAILRGSGAWVWLGVMRGGSCALSAPPNIPAICTVP